MKKDDLVLALEKYRVMYNQNSTSVKKQENEVKRLPFDEETFDKNEEPLKKKPRKSVSTSIRTKLNSTKFLNSIRNKHRIQKYDKHNRCEISISASEDTFTNDMTEEDDEVVNDSNNNDIDVTLDEDDTVTSKKNDEEEEDDEDDEEDEEDDDENESNGEEDEEEEEEVEEEENLQEAEDDDDDNNDDDDDEEEESEGEDKKSNVKNKTT